MLAAARQQAAIPRNRTLTEEEPTEYVANNTFVFVVHTTKRIPISLTQSKEESEPHPDPYIALNSILPVLQCL